MALLFRFPQVRGLTHAQLTRLAIGPIQGVPSPFVSDEAERQAWQVHRAKLMRTNAGTRPAGWYSFEAGEERDWSVPEPVQLDRLGALSAEEKAQISHEAWTFALRKR